MQENFPRVRMKRNQDMIDREMVLGELQSRVDRGIWGSACGTYGPSRAKALMLGDVVYGLFAHSVFGWYCEDIYCFNGRIYEKMDPDMLSWLVGELLRREGVDAGIRVYLSDFIRRAKLAIKMECELKPRFDLRAFSNGVVDLSTGDMKDFSPQWHVVNELGYCYDRDADCPTWKMFLQAVLPERTSRIILQMFMGLLVSDRSSIDEPLCLALYGKSVYGKSAVNELIRNLVGADSVSAESIETILKDGNMGMKNRTRLMGKTVNICSVLDDRFVVSHEEQFRNYLRGRDMKARFAKGVDFTLPSVPWQVFNFDTFPVDDSQGGGVFRKFLYVIFNEYIPEKDTNKSIGEELRNELPGILNWCVRGAKYARIHQYRFPSSTNTERSRIESVGQTDSMKAWMLFVKPSPRPRMEGDEPRWCRIMYMYCHYKKFCKANGFDTISIVAFGRFVRNYGFVGSNVRRGKNGTEIKVYGFSEEYEIESEVKLSKWRVMNDSEFDDITEC